MFFDPKRYPQQFSQDKLSQFVEQIDFQVNKFGLWWETPEDVNQIANFVMSDYEILYINSGKAKITYKNQTYIAEKGDMIFLKPLETYSAESASEPNELLRYYYIHFSIEPLYLNDKFQRLTGVDKEIIFKEELFQHISQSMQSLLDMEEQDRLGRNVLVKLSLVRSMVQLIINRFNDIGIVESINETSPKNIQTVRRALEYVDENLNKPLKISEIAKEIAVSENSMYKAFVDVFGFSPSEFILQHKLRKSLILLKSNNYSIEEIAEKMGFSSGFHYSKAFKALYEKSPTKYLKENTL